ncbi:hypothetical protein TELCIR_14347 [Teladorsagia circumcincta]|uniref:Uncharacterized protein n=1 Tax=Teladorsagia circumcincta TaxID=45464 RepID=A0A2G9U198_TELCI|nr:hypothetical protein TELCIR_14347 [Teladorsagia circumcincta]
MSDFATLGERIAAFVENSPREVTDSSAEISDLAKRQIQPKAATICKEIDVQTSIRVTELPVLTKELRDNATDVPSLDYLSMSDLGGLQQLPEAFAATQEDASSSAFSSDQSAGQAAGSMVSKAHTIIPFDRDGSVQIPPSKTVRVSDLVESSLPFGVEADGSSLRDSKFTTPSRPAGKASPRTPRVSESPWRPSSRRLHLEEVDISTSQENDSIGAVEDEHSTKESSDSSHQDEEHTYNQVSQIASE